MARAPRRDGPGTWHHVMNRGLARRTVFETRGDVRFFLSRVAQAVRRSELEVHAFSVLTTHFHLLVRSPRGKLAEGMRRVQNEYVRRFNRSRGRDGPLFRGRYRSRPVDSLYYRSVLVRYIDSNPVAARIVGDSREYPFGSAHWYGLRAGPPWLERSWVESSVGDVSSSDRYEPSEYATVFGVPLSPGLSRLVRLRVAGRRDGGDPLDDLVNGAPDAVLEWMKRKARLADGREPGLPVCDPDSVMKSIDRRRNQCGTWEIQRGRRLIDGWIFVQVGLLREMSGLSLRQISQRIPASVSGLFKILDRHRALLLEDSAYAIRVRAIAVDALHACGIAR